MKSVTHQAFPFSLLIFIRSKDYWGEEINIHAGRVCLKRMVGY